MKQSVVGVLVGCLLLGGFPAAGGAEQAPQGQASFAQLRENPAAYLGATVVLGGQIVHWSPAAHGPLLQVLQRPLGRGLRPDRLAFSGGWFWVRYPEQLGPLSLLAPYITVIGEVVGTEQGSPLILAQEVFLFSFWRAAGASLLSLPRCGKVWGTGAFFRRIRTHPTAIQWRILLH